MKFVVFVVSFAASVYASGEPKENGCLLDPHCPKNSKCVPDDHVSGLYDCICNPGYTKKKWNHCEANPCDKPGVPVNGYISKPNGPYPVGVVVIYECNNGFKLSGSRDTVCQLFNKWSNQVPRCIPTCGIPKVPSNGRIVDPKDSDELPYVEEDIVNYKCKSPYVLSGASMSICHNQEWDPPAPMCIAYCEHQSITSNVIETPSKKNRYDLGSEVAYVCKPGYKYDQEYREVAKCIGHKKWDKKPPTCSLITCGQPIAESKYVRFRDTLKESYIPGETVRASCYPSKYYYLYNRKDTLTCTLAADGKSASWVGSVQCRARSCKNRCSSFLYRTSYGRTSRECECGIRCNDPYYRRGNCCKDFAKYCSRRYY